MVMFVFMGLRYRDQYDHFWLHLFTCKFYDFVPDELGRSEPLVMMSSNDVHGVQLYYSHHQNVHLTGPDDVEEETRAQVCSSVFVSF